MAEANTQQHFWGIDLGGTKIEGAVLDSLTNLRAVARTRIDTEQHLGYEHILQRIKKLVDELSTQTGTKPKKLGVGTPGVVDPLTNLLKNSNTQCLQGKPLKTDLEALLKIPCTLANDANCFALAESYYGAAQNNNVVFGVIMGTGVGGGIVIDRKVLFGAQGIAGEWGHNVLDPNGPSCYCGKHGCVETLISGPALEAHFERLSGRKEKLESILSAGRRNPKGAEGETLGYLIEWFGKAIATVVNILDPDIIVLGGGVSNVDELYTAGAASAAQYVFNDRFETPIVKNALGDSAGVFGAAMLTAGG